MTGVRGREKDNQEPAVNGCEGVMGWGGCYLCSLKYFSPIRTVSSFFWRICRWRACATERGGVWEGRANHSLSQQEENTGFRVKRDNEV